MTSEQGQNQRKRQRSLVTAVVVAIAAVVVFGLGFAVAHHGAAKAAPAKVIDATIKPGPDAAHLRAKLGSEIAGLKKPVVHHKKKTVTTTTATTSTYIPVETTPVATPAPVYTPPATPAPVTKPKTKTTPEGSGVVTVG